ncbi:MAG: transglutaminase-like domain-containing protein [Candidatus Bathyarchaeaceae archaeon]
MRKKAIVAFILIMGVCATIFTPTNHLSRADSTGKWRTFDKKTLYVHGYMVYRYNRNASSDVDVSIPLWANNFWSEISLLKTEPISVGGYVKYNVATEQYDLSSKDDHDAIYGANFFFSNVQPYQEIKAEVWMKLSISKVDTSPILREHVGNVSASAAEVDSKYTEEQYYWDYSNSSVQKVIEEINQTIEGSRNVYDIVYATIDWFSTNMVYMEHEDYPAQRLKASQILNETIEVADVEKRYGVCRHFADAFVAIMRGFGVPTNLFEGLVFYDMGGYVGVIFSGGHAWCEVYMPNIGWVPVEVTISDKYLRDIIRVGLISEYYYLPTYKEFAHPAPKPPGEPEDKEPYEYLIGAYWGWGVDEVPPAGTLDSIIYAIKSTPVMVWILLAVIVVLIIDSILIRRKIKALTSKIPPPPPPPPSPTP